MNITIRSSDIVDVLEHPGQLLKSSGAATVVAGTGVFLPMDSVRQLAGNPTATAKLMEQVLEEEWLYAMVVLSRRTTGIDNTLWYQPVPDLPHGPRIKVAIDPPQAIRRGGAEATVPFDSASIGSISAALERQVRQFIELNKDVLIEYWNLDIPTDEFLSRLRPIR